MFNSFPRLKPVFLFVIPLFFLPTLTAQTPTYAEVVRQYFGNPAKAIPYDKAEEALRSFDVSMDTNASFHYFKGLSIGRSAFPNLHFIPTLSVERAQLSIQHFQKAFALGYVHNISHLPDAYYRHTVEWGQLLLATFYHKGANSVELKSLLSRAQQNRVPAFSPFLLAYAQQLLDECGRNTFLICNDDNIYYAVLFLMLTQNYRPDIVPIRKDLLLTSWYPAWLEKTYSVRFGFASSELASVTQISELEKLALQSLLLTVYPNSPVPKEIVDFTTGFAIQRDDILLLSLLSHQDPPRGVYLVNAMMQEPLFAKLSTQIRGLSRELILYPPAIDKKNWNLLQAKLEQMLKQVNTRSRQELHLIDELRLELIQSVAVYFDLGNKDTARELFLLLMETLSVDKYPSLDPGVATLLAQMATFVLEK